MWSTYCRYIGVQFMHIDDPVTRDWLQQRMEASENRISLVASRTVADPHAADRRGDLRAVRPQKICRREDVLVGRFGEPDSALGPGHCQGGPAGDRRDRDGHGPSGPAQRPGEHHRQESAGDLFRIRRFQSRMPGTAPATSPITWGSAATGRPKADAGSTCRSVSIPATWSSSIPWLSAGCGPSRIEPAMPSGERDWCC